MASARRLEYTRGRWRLASLASTWLACLAACPQGTQVNTQAPITVGPSGQYATIAEALSGAAAGGQIRVESGTYTESLVLDQDLSLVGAESASVVICAKAGVGIHVAPGRAVRIANLRVECAAGVGIWCEGAACTLESVVVQKVAADAAGRGGRGVLGEVGARLTLRGVELADNGGDGLHATGAAGVVLEPLAGTSVPPGALIRGNAGAGVVVRDPVLAEGELALRIAESAIETNAWGGVWIEGKAASLALEGVTLEDNQVAGVVAIGGSIQAVDTAIRTTQTQKKAGAACPAGDGVVLLAGATADLAGVSFEGQTGVDVLIVEGSLSTPVPPTATTLQVPGAGCPCWYQERCVEASCSQAQVACDDGDPCTAADACADGACHGAAPAELCNGEDDDCDTQTDETFTWSGLPLGASCTGDGCGGTVACAPDGGSAICVGQPCVCEEVTCRGPLQSVVVAPAVTSGLAVGPSGEVVAFHHTVEGKLASSRKTPDGWLTETIAEANPLLTFLGEDLSWGNDSPDILGVAFAPDGEPRLLHRFLEGLGGPPERYAVHGAGGWSERELPFQGTPLAIAANAAGVHLLSSAGTYGLDQGDQWVVHPVGASIAAGAQMVSDSQGGAGFLFEGAAGVELGVASALGASTRVVDPEGSGPLALALGGTDTWHVAYADSNDHIRAATSTEGAPWTVSVAGPPASGTVGLHVAADGAVHHLRNDAEGATYARWEGEGWVTAVAPAPVLSLVTRSALDANGVLRLLYFSFGDGELTTLRHARLDDAGAWILETLSEQAWGAPGLALGPGDTLHVAFNEGAPFTRYAVSGSPCCPRAAPTCECPAEVPWGVETWCEGEICQVRLGESSEALAMLQRIYRGAIMYYRHGWLSAGAEPLPCQFPMAQGSTPVENACCAAQGGPDSDVDAQCDFDPGIWSTDQWSMVDFEILTPHRFIYAMSTDTAGASAEKVLRISAFYDVCSTGERLALVVEGTAEGGPGCELTVPTAIAWYSGEDLIAELPLTDAQKAGFTVPPGVVSSNPFHGELTDNLEQMVQGAAAYYNAQAEPKQFPAAQSFTPVNNTCCNVQGGPDINLNNACDPNPLSWTTSQWQALNFSVEGEHRYIYSFTSSGSGENAKFTAQANGDLDCDSTRSKFQRYVSTTCDASGCKATPLEGMHGYMISE